VTLEKEELRYGSDDDGDDDSDDEIDDNDSNNDDDNDIDIHTYIIINIIIIIIIISGLNHNKCASSWGRYPSCRCCREL
jgi:hypothetical protein